MLDKNKQSFWKNINIYFLFVALAFGLSAYLLLLDNSSEYVAKTNILIYPKNIKTAVHIGRIKENIISIAEKNNLLGKGTTLENNEKNDLIEVQSIGRSEKEAASLAEKSTRKLIALSGKYYDIKKDLTLEVVSRETKSKTYNRELVLLISIFVGLALAFIIQLIFYLVEKLGLFFVNKRIGNKKKSSQTEYLGDFFKTNREKIEKLSSSFPLENKNRRMVLEDEIIKKDILKTKLPEFKDEPQVNFKRAASPPNLPIAEEDFDKIIQNKNNISNEQEVLSELGIFSESEARELLGKEDKEDKMEPNQPIDQAYADNLKDALGEPTEEDFKKRLNQLLGNK